MRKVGGVALALVVGVLLSVVVGVIAARLSHVSTFAVAGPTVSDGPRRAIEFRPSAQSVVSLALSWGIAAALVVIVVARCLRVRLATGSTNRDRGRTLYALCVVAGVALGSATVLLAHYASYTATIHAGQVGLVRPSWLPDLPIAICIGAVIGVAAAALLHAVGVQIEIGGHTDSDTSRRANAGPER